MAEPKLSMREIKRRVLVHLERIQCGQEKLEAMKEAKAPELTWDQIRAEVKVHLKRADLHRAKLAEAKRQAEAKPKRGGLFDDPVALANEIARVRAELEKRRKQAAAEAGSPLPGPPPPPALTASDNHAAGAVVDPAHIPIGSTLPG